jgi:hypothetical protein
MIKVVITKSFLYRGATEEWSNVYCFQGDDFTVELDAINWVEDLADIEALVVHEMNTYKSWLLYNDGEETATYSGDFEPGFIGAVGASVGAEQGGDTAYWVRWLLPDRNANGKKVYLRKYFHPGIADAADPDLVPAAMKTKLLAFGNELRQGAALGDYLLCSPSDGDLAGQEKAADFITTRTLKRRGRRPTGP